jgi:hypothetical protein
VRPGRAWAAASGGGRAARGRLSTVSRGRLGLARAAFDWGATGDLDLERVRNRVE